MIYDFVNPPFTLDFVNMSKSEIKEYYQWFLDNLQDRLEMLENLVNTFYGFEEWKADYSIDSLFLLGKWLNSEKEYRELSIQELSKIKSTLIFDVEVDTKIPTNRSLSIAYDIGMYFGQLWVENNSTLKWSLSLGSKKYIDYGQPIISGFGKMSFNPIRMITTQLYFLKKEPRDDCLLDFIIFGRNMYQLKK